MADIGQYELLFTFGLAHSRIHVLSCPGWQKMRVFGLWPSTVTLIFTSLGGEASRSTPVKMPLSQQTDLYSL